MLYKNTLIFSCIICFIGNQLVLYNIMSEILVGKEIKRDKFLVLSAKLDSADLTQSELAATWKTFSKSQVCL